MPANNHGTHVVLRVNDAQRQQIHEFLNNIESIIHDAQLESGYINWDMAWASCAEIRKITETAITPDGDLEIPTDIEPE